VTGSGKTYTIANVIQAVQKPTLVMAPNKTLAAQLYGEFRSFFPHNAVEYFVSYYDYYQPEAYIPSSDTFIDKDSSVNEHIEQMRPVGDQGAARAARRDHRLHRVRRSTASAIPANTTRWCCTWCGGERIDQRELIRRLTEMQYTRNEMDLTRGTYRVRGGNHRRASGGKRRRGAADRTVRRRDRNADAVRPADRRNAAQAAALHDLSEIALRDDAPHGARCRSRRSSSSCATGWKCCTRRTSWSRRSAWRNARSSTWK
jgi:hypothetical protein